MTYKHRAKRTIVSNGTAGGRVGWGVADDHSKGRTTFMGLDGYPTIFIEPTTSSSGSTEA